MICAREKSGPGVVEGAIVLVAVAVAVVVGSGFVDWLGKVGSFTVATWVLVGVGLAGGLVAAQAVRWSAAKLSRITTAARFIEILSVEMDSPIKFYSNVCGHLFQ